ncbi:MAG TPA: hypothetical protein VK508_06050 [Cyclobacteriaceae bacterium]|nr:hypothetical protein [Cyclobacteriaceae bacterium]
MLRAPLVACILIAGADGNVDRKEIEKAIHHTRKSAKKSKASIVEYFKLVEEDFEDKLKIVLQTLPVQVADRNHLIVEELTRLNSILPKLNKLFATEFYAKMRGLAHEVASSSGGVLGINKVGEEEAQYIELSMIRNPA